MDAVPDLNESSAVSDGYEGNLKGVLRQSGMVKGVLHTGLLLLIFWGLAEVVIFCFFYFLFLLSLL